MDWKNSIYSDGSCNFVQPEIPTLGQKVSIRLQMLSNTEVKGVLLRRIKNGSEHLDSMQLQTDRNGWFDYVVDILMNQSEIRYHFYIYTDSAIYFYNQYELSEVVPTEVHDFKLVAGYEAPRWVRQSVFYQIFPDRFCNGNPDNDVKDNEYTFDGHPTIHMPWGETPKEYHDVFCLDFYGGDLEGVAQKIPYLKEMGFNALYINPIFYSATSHRYDCLDYFTVDPHLGGDEALAELSTELKKESMKLILDVSINHTGTAHRWFNKESVFFPSSVGAFQNKDSVERDYYFFDADGDYHKWAGVDTLPTLNYTSDALRHILYGDEDSMVKKWLKPPYSIDGWRFDVANDMARNDAVDLSHTVWPQIRQSIKAVNQDAYILGEQWVDCPEFLRGNEWDSPMNYYGCTRPVRHFVGELDLFLARTPEFKPMNLRLTAVQLKQRILQHLSRMPYALQANQFNLLDSHDVARLHNNPKITFSAYEIAVMMLFTLPGTPNVYYGDEVGLDGTINTIEGCRYPMEWDKEQWNTSFVHLYKTLAHLKLESSCLHDGGFKFIYTDGFVVSYARFLEDSVLLLVASMDEVPQSVQLAVGEIGIDTTLSPWSYEEVLGKKNTSFQLEKDVLTLTVPSKTGYLLKFSKGNS